LRFRGDLVVQVRVKGYLTFRGLIGEQVVQFEDDVQVTLADLLAVLFSTCGEELKKQMLDEETGGLSRRVAVLVNGRHYTHTSERLRILLKDGDEISVFPPIAGGME
jgi:MoaD family protein